MFCFPPLTLFPAPPSPRLSIRPTGTMAGLGNVDSKAVFKARAIQIGLDDTIVGRLENSNLASFGAFAFSCSYQPGSQDETPLNWHALAPNETTFSPNGNSI